MSSWNEWNGQIFAEEKCAFKEASSQFANVKDKMLCETIQKMLFLSLCLDPVAGRPNLYQSSIFVKGLSTQNHCTLIIPVLEELEKEPETVPCKDDVTNHNLLMHFFYNCYIFQSRWLLYSCNKVDAWTCWGSWWSCSSSWSCSALTDLTRLDYRNAEAGKRSDGLLTCSHIMDAQSPEKALNKTAYLA